MRPHGTPEELERRRHRAVRLFREGHQPVDVARMVWVDRRSVRRWNAAYQTQGHAALAAKPASGRPPWLNARAVKLLTGTPSCRAPALPLLESGRKDEAGDSIDAGGVGRPSAH